MSKLHNRSENPRPRRLSYLQRLSKLPVPSDLSKVWAAFQFPGGILGSYGAFQRQGPMFNAYRPQNAKGTPASFALAAYGRFFDAKDSRQPSTAARETVMAMVDIMSKSYANTATDTARRILGPDFIGEDRGGARLMMQQLREVLLDFLQGAMIEETEFSLLERKHTISLGSWRSVGTMLLRWWTIRTSQLFSILSSLPLALRFLAIGSGCTHCSTPIC
ncbi:hypothetical protein WJX75_007276 [Coccomyxa subellipsoidea]|uniref:Uncharacterized protein n=1 Tax=Coccomyxa subellipsoidea TaxID=248742 RepID=A0ABR2YND1_9CHLO